MNIAVLSDIHGNLTALNAVLLDIKEKKIDKIIVAGDHISDCPSPVEVIKKLRQLDAICIKGNREQYIIDYIESGCNDWEYYHQMKSVDWTRKQLSPDELEWIYSLPEQEVIKLNSAENIRVVHGSTESMFEHLYDYKPQRLKEVLSGIAEKVLICGHSHIPWIKEFSDSLVINPGSVGVSFNQETAADYGVLTWDGIKWCGSLHKAPYSYNELFDNFKTSGLYDYCVWGKLILQSIRDGRNRNIEFINKVNENKGQSGDNSSGYIKNDIWDKTVREWFFT